MSGLSGRRLLIVDDHQIIRAGLTTALLAQGCSEILQAGSFRAAAELISSEDFELILTDQHLGDGNGLDLAHIARRKNPNVKMALLTFDENWALIEGARELGFSLYVSKQSPLNTIMGALIEALDSVDTFAIYAPSLPRDNGLAAALTKSELVVLGLLCEGFTTREISAKLFNSEATIKTHTASILRKLQSRNRIEAIKKARELRLIAAT